MMIFLKKFLRQMYPDLRFNVTKDLHASCRVCIQYYNERLITEQLLR